MQTSVESGAAPSVRPVFVLGLCGGGVRGVATVSFLAEMEKERRKTVPDFKLSDAFDVFAGVSIGSVFAILLGSVGKTAEELSQICCAATCKAIFPKSMLDRLVSNVQLSPKYPSEGARRVFTQHIGAETEFRCPGGKKKVLALSFDINRNEAHIWDTDDPVRVSAVDVAMASSAAPTYFPSARVTTTTTTSPVTSSSGGAPGQVVETHFHSDGGSQQNDPSLVAYTETIELLRRSNQSGRPIKVLTVGTGRNKPCVHPSDTEKYGGIQYMMCGYIFEVFSNQSLVRKMTRTLLGDDYVSVDSTLPSNVSDALDDTSEENIRNLAELGKFWWKKHRVEIMKLMEWN